MKTYYTFVLAALISYQSFAQPVLTQSNGFSDGVTIHLFDDQAPTLNEGTGGVNQTWDFSSLSSADTAIAYYGMLASATPYASSFPNAEIAAKHVDAFADSIYDFFTNDATEYKTWGWAFNLQVLDYANPRDILHYPFTYQDSFSDSYFFDSPYSSDYGEVEITADGYGTLILPQGGFDSCLRVRQVRRDTAVGEFWVNYSNDTSYKFYSPAFVEPLCEVIHHHPTNLNSYSEIYWQDVLGEGVTSTGDGNKPVTFPNPCVDHLNILLPSVNEVATIQVTDIAGKQFTIPFKQITGSLLQLNTSQLHPGVYFASAKSANKESRVRFVKMSER